MKKFRLRPKTSRVNDPKFTVEVELHILNNLLQDAVNKEKYELAAIIKNRMDAINKPNNKGD